MTVSFRTNCVQPCTALAFLLHVRALCSRNAARVIWVVQQSAGVTII